MNKVDYIDRYSYFQSNNYMRKSSVEQEIIKANFDEIVKNYDYVLRSRDKAYDPEGISSNWVDEYVLYASDSVYLLYDILSDIMLDAKNNKDVKMTIKNDVCEIYYYNNQSRVLYDVIPNPYKQDLSTENDIEGMEL